MSLKQSNAKIHSLKVRYSEIDSQAIVYNSHYLTYYDISLSENRLLITFLKKTRKYSSKPKTIDYIYTIN